MNDTKTTTTENADHEPELKVVDRRWWVKEQQAGGGAGQADTGAADTPAWTPPKPTYVEQLEQQLADKNNLLQDYITQYKQATREFEDVKARIRRDVLKDVERSKRAILAELLDVADNLDRAVDAAAKTPNFDALLQGVGMVSQELQTKLRGFGIRKIDAVGKPFDPARHEAVSMVPVTDPGQDETVVAVVKDGYTIGDDILRPALVAVGRTS